MRRPGSSHRFALVTGTLAIAAAALTGCSNSRDPNQPLSADEGASLLRDIRDDRGRMKDLTPQERAYIMRTLK